MAAVLAVIFFVASYKIKRVVKICALSVVVFAVVLPFCSETMLDYLESTLFFWDQSSQKTFITGSSMDMRYDQFAAAFEIVEKNVIGGMGYDLQDYSNNSSSLFRRLMGYESILIKVVVEQGLLGLLCYVIFFSTLCLYFIKRTALKERRILVIGYCASFLLSALFTGIQGFSLLLFMLYLWIDLKDEEYKNENTLAV